MDDKVNFTQGNTNATEEEQYVFLSIFAGCFGLLMGTAGTVGNLAVILVCFLDESISSQASNILILNLAIADLACLIFITITSSIATILGYWPFGEFMCQLTAMIYNPCVVASMFLLALVSLDRGIAIIRPLQYNQLVNKKKLVIASLLAWIESYIMLIILYFYIPIKYEKYQALCTFVWIELKEIPAYPIAATVINGLIPLFIIIYFNYRIVKSAMKESMNKIKPQREGTSKSVNISSKYSNKGNLKVIISILLVVAVYFICFFPIVIVRLLSISGIVKVPRGAALFGTYCQFVSSVVNPYIYGILRKDYREAFQKLPRHINEKIPCV